MNELEDEPEDVQNATPVEEEVKKGEIDEVSIKKKNVSSKSNEELPRHRCQKDKPAIQTVDCCEAKRQKAAAAQQKTATMYVHEEPCKLVKPEIIPRHCLSKDEYIDFLAKPKEKCADSCAKKRIERRVRALSPRIDELAKAPTRRLMHTLEHRAAILSPQMLENLLDYLERKTALTIDQAENLVRDKVAQSKKASSKKKKKSKTGKCRGKVQNKPRLEAGDPSVDLEAADRQYSMAQRFVRSIRNSKCSLPRDDYRDIAEAILEAMSEQLEYTPIGNEDRKSQQMRILADAFACWVSEILIRVSEKHRAELERECLRRRQELEELVAREELEAEQAAEDEDEDVDGAGSQDEDDEDDEDEKCRQLAAAASLARNLAESEKALSDKMSQSAERRLGVEDSTTQYEAEDVEDEEQQLTAASFPTSGSQLGSEAYEDEGADESDGGDTELEYVEGLMLLDEGVDAEQQTETGDRTDAGTEIDAKTLKSALSAKSRDMLELEKIASRMGENFQTDVPFVTFAKLMDTLYEMIQCEAENTLEDPIDNRVHRAIYEKFAAVIRREDASLLTDRTKDVVDVVSGKLAKWLRCTLDQQQIRFLDEQQPAQVESREVRDWSEWLNGVTDLADDWSRWINQMATEASCIKRVGKMTRGEWQEWTGRFETNALHWRENYLKTVHQGHHNTMMMAERKVLKTGTKKWPARYDETTIKNTNFDSSSRM